MSAIRPEGPRPAAGAAPDGVPVLAAETLFGTGREVVIAHRGALYRLRITQNGKLILTK